MTLVKYSVAYWSLPLQGLLPDLFMLYTLYKYLCKKKFKHLFTCTNFNNNPWLLYLILKLCYGVYTHINKGVPVKGPMFAFLGNIKKLFEVKAHIARDYM